MDSQEIKQRTAALDDLIAKYKSDLGVLERELAKTIGDYHEALRVEKLKEIKKDMEKKI
jgi:hypothetical protein